MSAAFALSFTLVLASVALFAFAILAPAKPERPRSVQPAVHAAARSAPAERIRGLERMACGDSRTIAEIERALDDPDDAIAACAAVLALRERRFDLVRMRTERLAALLPAHSIFLLK